MKPYLSAFSNILKKKEDHEDPSKHKTDTVAVWISQYPDPPPSRQAAAADEG
jgi:hypothetical protein